jgi:hypothetical protein
MRHYSKKAVAIAKARTLDMMLMAASGMLILAAIIVKLTS